MGDQVSISEAILVVLAAWVIYNHINYFVTGKLLRFLYIKYRNEAAMLENSGELDSKIIEKSGLSKERAVLEVSTHRHGAKFSLRSVVANLEFIFVAAITFAALQSSSNLTMYDIGYKIGIVVLAWLGIKVIGNYGQWQQPIFGRSLFYVFLFGTIFNVTLGILAGWLLANIF